VRGGRERELPLREGGTSGDGHGRSEATKRSGLSGGNGSGNNCDAMVSN
jgi:hypothetical protein